MKVRAQPKLVNIHVRVQNDLYVGLSAVRWGIRGHLIEAVLGIVVDAIRTEGMSIVGDIIAGEFKLVRAKKPDVPS